MNDVDSSVCLEDVFTRLLTFPVSRIEELLTHRWAPAAR
jgi:hypothetical protein